MTFTARYRGECAACYEDILPGQEAAYGVGGKVVHVVCPEPVPEVRRPVCPACFTEIPVSGVCGVCE